MKKILMAVICLLLAACGSSKMKEEVSITLKDGKTVLITVAMGLEFCTEGQPSGQQLNVSYLERQLDVRRQIRGAFADLTAADFQREVNGTAQRLAETLVANYGERIVCITSAEVFYSNAPAWPKRNG